MRRRRLLAVRSFVILAGLACIQAADSAPSSSGAPANIWRGGSAAGPQDWNLAENWSAGKAPSLNDSCNVVIPGGVASYPKLSRNVVIDGSLTVEAGATLTLAGHDVSLGSLPADNKKGVTIRGTLDASGAPSLIAVGRGGFTNAGKIRGTLALAFGIDGSCHGAQLTAGGASLTSLILGEDSNSSTVTVMDNVTVEGNVHVAGNTLAVSPKATLTILKDLVFEGKSQNAGLTPSGPVLLHGTIIGSNSALCTGAGYDDQWVTLVGEGDQVISPGGILPPIKVAKPKGVVTVASDMACGGLWVAKGNTVDLSAAKELRFGGGESSRFARGLVNEGTIVGKPSLTFGAGCYSASLIPGSTEIAGLIADTGNYNYAVDLIGNVVVTGDVHLKTGTLQFRERAKLTVGGSCHIAPFVANASSIRFLMGKDSELIFNTGSNSVLDPGGPEIAGNYEAGLRNITIDKPGGKLTLKHHNLAVRGALSIKAGVLDMADGAALLLYPVYVGTVHDTRGVVLADVGLQVRSPLTPEILAKKPGPAIPAGLKLVNIAPHAKIKTFPYGTLVKRMVDRDEGLGTALSLERIGDKPFVPRYEFRFDAPREIASVRFSSPGGLPYAICVDSDGSGKYDTLIVWDTTSRIGVEDAKWATKAYAEKTFVPPIKCYGVKLTAECPIYDVQILSPPDAATANATFSEPQPGISEIEAGETIRVADPPVEKQFLKGFHIEPWMFVNCKWFEEPPSKRPPLQTQKQFMEFVQSIKRMHGNLVWIFPPRTFATPRSNGGTYPFDVLWPSKYEVNCSSENFLKTICDLFRQEGIKVLIQDRDPIWRLQEDPKAEPLPVIGRAWRDTWAGVVREEVESGVDGVGVCIDEQFWNVFSQSLDAKLKEFARKRYRGGSTTSPSDTDEYNKSCLLIYDEVASCLKQASLAAKKANPKVWTCSNLGVYEAIYNDRIDWGLAYDIIGHTADIDLLGTDPYFSMIDGNLGHYECAAMTKRLVAANKKRQSIVTLLTPAFADLAPYPYYSRTFPPVEMYGTPLSTVMHGGTASAFWRYNFVFYGGYDKYVEQSFGILDTLAAWGMKEARIPRQIAVLKSRASEDWWQIKHRFGKDRNPADQIRGHVYEKWLLEFLFANGYPFEMYYLDQPQDLKDLSQFQLVILPFPYSIQIEAYDALEEAVKHGTKVLVFDRQGETDEYGAFYPKPLLADMIAEKQISFIGDDIPAVGHYPETLEKTRAAVDGLLGDRKPLYLNTYGNDVEVGLLEKGAGEKFLFAINWTDYDVKIDVGVNMLPAGQYQVFQRDLVDARKARIGGKEHASAQELRKFRVTLQKGGIKVFYLHPVAN